MVKLPKTSKDFSATLNFGVDIGLKIKLTAAGYMLQGKHEYASQARNMLQRGFDLWYNQLGAEDRKLFAAILDNTKIIDGQ